VIKIIVLYKKPSDTEKFDAHYLGTHMPLAAKLPGLLRAETVKPSPGLDGSEPPFYMQTELVFDSADLMGVFGSAEGAAVTADMANFETDGMVMLTGDVVFNAP
jgi:uncharacterized protein (TIGR02118 family)